MSCSAILSGHPDIVMAGVMQESATVAQDVIALKPDVILLEEDAGGAQVGQIRALLTSPIPCRLITLRMDVDGMHVWSQTWHQTIRSRDLVEAIVTAKPSSLGEGDS